MIRIILILCILVGAIGFGFQNRAETITIHYVPGLATEGVPVYILALGSFIVGMVAGIVMTLPSWMKDKLALRKHRKVLSRAEDELSRMRSAESKNTEEPRL